jgi:hypothetical protein
VLSLCVFWSWHLNLYYTRSKTLSLSLSLFPVNYVVLWPT